MVDEPKENEKVPLSVEAFLAQSMQVFAELAWQKLGLTPDPVTNQVHEDLIQAKLAIDVVTDLARHAELGLDGEDKRMVQNLVTDLKLNYVSRQK